MAGASLNAYLDLINRTGPAVFSTKEEIVNDAVKQTYGIAPFMKGKGIAEMFAGGKYITDEWFPDESSTAITHLPGASFTWSNPQTSRYWSANYRFLMDHMSVIDQEEDLNGPEQTAGMARFQQIKKMMFGKKQRLMTSKYNKMDSLLFAEPDFNSMEFSTSTSSTSADPYSLACFVNEYSNGLFNSTGTGAAGTAWTTVEGINPTSTGNTKWKNARVTYSSSSTAAAAATGSAATGVVNVGDVISGFDEMYLQVDFRPPTSFQEYFERAATEQMFVATSKKGYTHLQQSIRARQSTWNWTASGNNPGIGGLNYMGIPVYYWQGLDTATLYPNDTATPASTTDNVTEGATGASGGTPVDKKGIGPRYYFLHPKYMLPVFHEKWYLRFRDPIKPSDQPEATIIPVSTWYNFVCRSRQRQGVLYPLQITGGVFSVY